MAGIVWVFVAIIVAGIVFNCTKTFILPLLHQLIHYMCFKIKIVIPCISPGSLRVAISVGVLKEVELTTPLVYG